jgi:hypothetical protein
MAQLATIAIHSPKNPAWCWRINATDFDPNVHTRWGELPTQAVDVNSGRSLAADPLGSVPGESRDQRERAVKSDGPSAAIAPPSPPPAPPKAGLVDVTPKPKRKAKR